MSYQSEVARGGGEGGGSGEDRPRGSDEGREARDSRLTRTDRGTGGPRGDRSGGRGAADGASQRPKGAPYREQGQWAQVAAFAAGIAVGALLGAGTALLAAPQSGVETRLALKRRARTARVRAEDRWGDLGRELRNATRRGRRNVRRGLAKSRWRAADAFEG